MTIKQALETYFGVDLPIICPRYNLNSESLTSPVIDRPVKVIERDPVQDDEAYMGELQIYTEGLLRHNIFCASCHRKISGSNFVFICDNYDKLLEEEPHIEISGTTIHYCPHCGRRLLFDKARYIEPEKLEDNFWHNKKEW